MKASFSGSIKRFTANDFGTDHVQFTWDLIDPWWPEELRDVLALRYRDAFAKAGVHIDATFGGLASYSYGHFLAPSKEQREAAFLFFKRAIDLTAVMGAKVMGSPRYVSPLSLSLSRRRPGVLHNRAFLRTTLPAWPMYLLYPFLFPVGGQASFIMEHFFVQRFPPGRI